MGEKRTAQTTTIAVVVYISAADSYLENVSLITSYLYRQLIQKQRLTSGGLDDKLHLNPHEGSPAAVYNDFLKHMYDHSFGALN